MMKEIKMSGIATSDSLSAYIHKPYIVHLNLEWCLLYLNYTYTWVSNKQVPPNSETKAKNVRKNCQL